MISVLWKHINYTSWFELWAAASKAEGYTPVFGLLTVQRGQCVSYHVFFLCCYQISIQQWAVLWQSSHIVTFFKRLNLTLFYINYVSSGYSFSEKLQLDITVFYYWKRVPQLMLAASPFFLNSYFRVLKKNKLLNHRKSNWSDTSILLAESKI